MRRIDKQYILNEIRSVLFLERGLLFTLKELLVRPGKSVREFLKKDRKRLIKPVIFIILTSLIYSLINQFFPFEDRYIRAGDMGNSYTIKLTSWITNNYGYSNLLMGSIIAIFIKIFFRKYNYNFFEILILLCFVMGFSMIILSIFGLVEHFTFIPLLKYGAIGSILYMTWAIADVFGRSLVNIFKSLMSYLIGSLLFMVLTVLIGMALDLILA